LKNLFTLPLICLVLQSAAQNFYFPKQYYKDSITLGKEIPALAKQVIAVYKEGDKRTYFDNLSRYQTVAEQYTDAIKSIDSLLILLKKLDTTDKSIGGVYFQFQTFCAAKLMETEQRVTFQDAYHSTFVRMLEALPKEAALNAGIFFNFNLLQLHDQLYSLLNKQSDKDSISFNDAEMLCSIFNLFNVNSQVQPLAVPLLAQGKERKKYIIDDSVLIRTRDGATVEATVIRKRDMDYKLPAIFVFNIYKNSQGDESIAIDAAIKGYVAIVANTRGKGLSPQEIEPFEHDAKDAYDIIDWISKQSWSNGKVGMFGGSYLGFSQWAAVKTVHPALKTIVPQVAVGIGVDYPMQNNVFMSYMLRWIHYVTNSKETDQVDFNREDHWDSTFKKWYVSGKAYRSLDTIEGRPSKIFQRWLIHPSYDNYWQNMVPYKSDFSKINIPVLTVTGYYDADQEGAMYYFNQHHLYNKKATHYLLIGPYNHGGAQYLPSSVLGGYRIDSVANINISNLVFQWFDFILKDSARPAILKDKINYEVMGANEWRHAGTLSKMNNDTITLYLSNMRVSQDYKMEAKPYPTLEFIRQEVDFEDRKDTIDDRPWRISDSSLDNSNGLSFVSKPFNKPFEINGSFFGELKASINKKDMDVSVAIYELTPDEKYFRLLGRSTLIRASYSKSRVQRQLLEPGKMETIPINNSYFTSKKIGAGSRLVFVLAVNKSKDWQINYGTGKDVSDETIDDGKIPLQIKWYNSSVIKIPVLK